MDIREKIFVKICEASVGIGPKQLNAAKLADAIQQIPEIKEALDNTCPNCGTEAVILLCPLCAGA